jgi:hypothetical protein
MGTLSRFCVSDDNQLTSLEQLTKALVERALDGELTHPLGYEKHSSAGDNSGNSRNGTTPKTLRGKRGQVRVFLLKCALTARPPGSHPAGRRTGRRLRPGVVVGELHEIQSQVNDRLRVGS